MTEEQQLQKGFNTGYLLEKHDPKLSAEMRKTLQDVKTPYAVGFLQGIKEYTVERLKTRHKRISRDKDRNQDRDMDR
jgi:predicted MPP superfamily phosphohydrolase